jgi:hypothetical protein
MDFTAYVRKLEAIAGKMQSSERFHIHFTLRPPAHPEDVADMEAELAEEEGMEGFSIPAELKQFYTAANGFELGWQEVRSGDERIVAGSARLPIINAIYEPEDEAGQPRTLLYQRYRLFDWTGEEDQVYMKFTPGAAEPRLFYHARETGEYHELALGFTEYLELLLEARAMYPWQRLFVKDDALRLDGSARETFMAEVKRLFPDADTSRFRGE